MSTASSLKLLFIINPVSGKNKTDWSLLIREHFKELPHIIELFDLPADCNIDAIKKEIKKFQPDRVVAVGGDGTVKLVAESLLKSSIPLGILPAGSANGLTKELGIPQDPAAAIDACITGVPKKIHLVQVNDDICIHLSDIGFNAFVVKKFETGNGRGMWGYVKAAWKVLWQQPHMEVEMQIDGESVKRSVAMLVIANATRYGSGAMINPEGKLDDELFEVIAVKRVSAAEIFKMMVTHKPYDPEKTEVFQAGKLQVRSKRKVHFQVDGEYLGKINDIKASILLDALDVIVPEEK